MNFIYERQRCSDQLRRIRGSIRKSIRVERASTPAPLGASPTGRIGK
jgi:hypothetical protein